MTDRNRQPDNDLNLEDPLGIAQTPVARDAVNIARETDDEATVRRRRAGPVWTGTTTGPGRVRTIPTRTGRPASTWATAATART